MAKNFKERISNIKAFAFDCDGVMTDGTVTMCEDFEMRRTYNAKDGYALLHAIEKGYPIAIISRGTGVAMRLRFEKKLGIKDIYLSTGDKVADLLDFCKKWSIEPSDVLYMGDDIPDIKAMKIAGLSVAPADAVLDVKAIATHVSPYGGGKGCVRDAIEQVMKARGDWDWE